MLMSKNVMPLREQIARVRRILSGARRRAIRLIERIPVLKRLLPLSLSIVSDEASFIALQKEWEDLFARSAVQMPFLRYWWLQQSWKRRRDTNETSLFVVVVRKYGRPVLMAPLLKRECSLLFLDSLTPQYNDVLIENSAKAPKYVDYFWNTLCGMRSAKYFESKWVRDDSPLARYLAKARRDESPGGIWRAPFIDLEKFDDWDAYLQSLPAKLRQGHRRRLRNLQRSGTVEFRMANAESCASDMAWMFAQKRQWADRMDKSDRWIRASATEEFFTAAAREGIESGRTWLTVLSVDGATIAAILAFRDGSTLYGSKDGFDPAWHAYSPGRMLKLMTFERAFQEGVRKIDMMLGGYPWKLELANGMMRVRSRTVYLRKRAKKSTK
jgi:CelD/BcsL family acetyltransferase involved in cellulose biosynthesis